MYRKQISRPIKLQYCDHNLMTARERLKRCRHPNCQGMMDYGVMLHKNYLVIDYRVYFLFMENVR